MKIIKTAAGEFRVDDDGRVSFKGFCPTGEDGKVDNSCGNKPGAGGAKSDGKKPAARPQPSGVLAEQAPPKGVSREQWADARKKAREALRKVRAEHHESRVADHGKREQENGGEVEKSRGILASKGPAEGQSREDWADARKAAREKIRHAKEEQSYSKRAKAHHAREGRIQKKIQGRAARRKPKR